MRISERLLTVLVICLLVTAVPAFSRGKGERELKQSQELIDRKQYSEAITQLAETLRDFPELREQINKQVTGIIDQAIVLVKEKEFAEAMNLLVQVIERFPDLRKQADKVVAEIMAAREKFNEKYTELLAVIKEVPPDVELGLAIIKELTDLDPNPDPAIIESINIARQKLVSAGQYQLFTETMDAASALIKDGKPREAMTAYREKVFPIARADFDTAPHPALLRERALSAVRSLEEATRQAETQVDAFAGLPAALDALLAAPVTDAGREVFIGKLQLLVQAGQLEARIRTHGVGVRDVNAAIDTANGVDGFKDLWLGFMEQAALGRKESQPEGIAFAARQLWVGRMRELSDKAVPAAVDSFQKTEKAFAGKIDLPVFRALAADARNRALVAQSVLDVEAAAWAPAEGLTLSPEDTARAAGVKERATQMKRQAADADAMAAFAEAEVAAGGTLAELDRQLKLVPPASSADTGQLERGREVLGAIRASSGSGAAEWAQRATSAASTPTMAKRAGDLRDRFRGIADRTHAADTALAVRIAGLGAAEFERRRTEAESRMETGRALAAGTAVGQPQGKWPDRAKELHEQTREVVRVLQRDIDTWRARWTSAQDPVNGEPGIARLVEVQDDLRGRVVELQGRILAAIAEAQNALNTAQQLRGQGESAFQEGQAKEKQRKFTDALNSYTTATESYGDSLSWQENAIARARLEELARIVERVKRSANQQNLDAVQVLTDKGIKQYTEGDYEGAVKSLEEARKLWEASVGGENQTVTVYLERATGALKVAGKQEITRTDPIYQDIRGFMTQAELSYNRAEALRNAASRADEYRSTLAAARSSVQAITAVVPEYRDARLMALRIDRLELGAAEFLNKLRANENTAITDARNPQAGEIRWRDAYYSLKAYREFEPDAARRRDVIDPAIRTLEVRLGLRPPDPDPALVAASRSDYGKANAAYRTNVNDRAQWESALWFLQKSLAAWPENADARKLQTLIVGKRATSVDVLSDVELERYRAALRDFLSRNYSRAEAIVRELLQAKPRNPLLIALRDQIQGAR